LPFLRKRSRNGPQIAENDIERRSLIIYEKLFVKFTDKRVKNLLLNLFPKKT